jgi:hypothetical protein
VERQQLLTKGQIFKHEVLTGLEGANRPAEKGLSHAIMARILTKHLPPS